MTPPADIATLDADAARLLPARSQAAWARLRALLVRDMASYGHVAEHRARDARAEDETRPVAIDPERVIGADGPWKGATVRDPLVRAEPEDDGPIAGGLRP